MKSDISFYFILYLVAVVTVFAITVERDRTLEQRNELIAQMIEVYVKPLKVKPYIDTSKFYIDVSRAAMDDSARVKVRSEGPLIRDDIDFSIVAVSRMTQQGTEWVSGMGRIYNEFGDGVVVTPPLAEGTYVFRVAGHKNRIVTHGNSMSVLIGDSTYNIPYARRFEKVDRDTTDLIVSVVKSGLEKQQITLSVTDANDHWILGLPYTKKIFLGGIETMIGLTASASPTGRIERIKDESSAYLFTWDNPTIGKHAFTVTVSASRGAGGKDRASTTFNVDIRPPNFINPPAAKGFWGIPYTIDGQVAGINPLDLTVEYAHDGQSLGSAPASPPIVVTPARGWNTLTFAVKYHGALIKDHKAPLNAPPPPQVRWTQQNLDRSRNLFTIQFTCSDAAGGPVTISLQSQPSGIAKIDRIRGTSFNINVDLSSHPVSVFLKLIATDQYGGQSTSSKQFNIPQ